MSIVHSSPRYATLLGGLALLTLATVGCDGAGAGGLRDADRARSYNAAGKSIVMVVDVSGSMTQNDPDRMSLEGTQLIAGLVEPGDNLACLKFSSMAHVIAPLRTIRTPDDRKQFTSEIGRVRREGETNYVDALATAYAILDEKGASRGSTVLFMTDGDPNVPSPDGSPAQILAEVDKFRARGWKIQTVGLGADAHADILTQLATRTGGGVYFTNSPEELLRAYIQISGELQDLIVAKEIRPVRLFPNTSRVLYVILKGDPSTHISQITREGGDQPLDGPSIYHYLGQKSFEVVRYENPQSGRWDGKVDGPYKVGMVLAKAPFEFSFEEGAPKREQVDGQPVRVTLLVKGDAVDQIKSASAVTANIASFDGGRVASFPLVLQASAAPSTLAFSGEFTPHLRSPGTPETHTVEAHFTYRDGDVVWEHDSRVAYRLVGRPAAGIEIDPAAVDLGALFPGDAPKPVMVAVRARGAAAKHIVIRPSAGARASPSALDDVVQPAQVRVSLDPPAQPGPVSWTVQFKPGAGGDDSMAATLTIKARLLRLRAPNAVALGDVIAGEKGGAPVEISGDNYKVQLGTLNGPNGAALPMELVDEGGRQRLICKVPKEAPPGHYQGIMNVSVAEGTKAVPVTVDVTPAQARLSGLPDKVPLSFSGTSNGWTQASDCDAKLDYAEPCDVKVGWSDLKPKSGMGPGVRKDQFKVEVDGLDDGKLSPDRPAKVHAKAYVNLNLPPGTYAGQIDLTTRSADGRQTVQKLPVELTVTR